MTPARDLRVLITVDAVGGIWQYATDLAGALAETGTETVLALMGPPPSAAMLAAIDGRPGIAIVDTGADLDWLAADADGVREGARRIAELGADMRCDLLQLNTPALAGAARFDAPVIAVAHSCVTSWWDAVEGGALPDDLAWRGAMTRAGLHAADRAVAPSRAFAMATRRLHRLPTLPDIVHNGRETPAPAQRPMRDVAFTAGRLWDRGKDLATLDRAAARLGLPVRAAGATCGPNGETVILDHLHCLGRIEEDEVREHLAARPVFVSTARYEPFGLAVLEAAAAGCPLVLSDIPTFRELWDGAAQFVAPGDDTGFAAAIERTIGDPSARLAWGGRAQERARRYTPRAMANGIAAIYAALCPRRLPRRSVDRAEMRISV